MNPQLLLFNALNAMGLILIALGTWRLFGIPVALIASGGTVLIVNLFVLTATQR